MQCILETIYKVVKYTKFVMHNDKDYGKVRSFYNIRYGNHDGGRRAWCSTSDSVKWEVGGRHISRVSG